MSTVDDVLLDRARWTVVEGDSLAIMRQMPANSVHSIVCDPPAGIDFMGKEFDSNRGGREPWIEWLVAIMREAFRALCPGGHALVWALPRTSHWTGCALEDAGFTIRDSLHHVFGQGFPKGVNVAKAIDKRAGVKPIGERPPSLGMATGPNADQWNALNRQIIMPPPTTPDAKKWDGWNTAIKPAHEVWWLAQKPLSERTVIDNVLR